MSKHHIQNLAEQIIKKGHASSPFHSGKKHEQARKAVKPEEMREHVKSNDKDVSRLINEGDPNIQK
jgi:hypothetical protein